MRNLRLDYMTVALACAVLLGSTGDAGAAGLGQRCGGFVGIPCNRGLWCELPAGTCRSADLFGKCVRVPQVCTKIYRPVCGCNGRTYGNDCERRAARVQKAHEGPCRRRG